LWKKLGREEGILFFLRNSSTLLYTLALRVLRKVCFRFAFCIVRIKKEEKANHPKIFILFVFLYYGDENGITDEGWRSSYRRRL